LKRNSVLIVTSCLIGLITAMTYASRIRHLRDEITSLSEKVPVLVVARDIRMGETLTVEDLAESQLIKEQVSARTVSPDDLELILDRRVIHPLPAGDPILWTDFPEGPRVRHPSEEIPSGLRAIALNADETHTLVHFISPGDTVDIVSSGFDSSAGRLFSRLIAENIFVLGVGHQLGSRSNNPDRDDYPLSVTLLADPEKALLILQASQTGEVHFLARGSSPFAGLPNQNDRTAPTISLPGGK